jgi:hypothetical protein
VTPHEKSKRARAEFFVRVGQVGRRSRRCEQTLPLFPLWLILDADGTLARELASVVERTRASRAASCA